MKIGGKSIGRMPWEKASGSGQPTGFTDTRTGKKYTPEDLAVSNSLYNQEYINPWQIPASYEKQISAWASTPGGGDVTKYQLDQQRLSEQSAAGKLQSSLAGQQAGAMSNMALRGGLSSGARERIAQQGLRSSAEAEQALRAEAMGQRSGIQAQGEAARLGALQNLYGQRMSAWAAGQAAKEQNKASRSKFLGIF